MSIKDKSISRRQFLKYSGLGFLGLALANLTNLLSFSGLSSLNFKQPETKTVGKNQVSSGYGRGGYGA